MQAQRTQPGRKVFLTEEKVKAADAEEAARRTGGRLATLKEFCMDEDFVKANGGEWVFIAWKDAPGESAWYYVDRERNALTKITENESKFLYWHERVCLNESASDAIKEKRLLVAGGNYGSKDRLIVGGSGGSVARVAYVKDEAPAPISQEHAIHFPMPSTDPKRWEALKRDLGIVPDKDVSLSDDLPHPAREINFTTNGIKYRILGYEKGEGPNLKQTIETAEQMGLLILTSEEARAIRDNDEFRTALEPGEWGYVRDTETEKQSRAAYLYRDGNGRLYVGGYNYRPDDAAPAVVLREND